MTHIATVKLQIMETEDVAFVLVCADPPVPEIAERPSRAPLPGDRPQWIKDYVNRHAMVSHLQELGILNRTIAEKLHREPLNGELFELSAFVVSLKDTFRSFALYAPGPVH